MYVCACRLICDKFELEDNLSLEDVIKLNCKRKNMYMWKTGEFSAACQVTPEGQLGHCSQTKSSFFKHFFVIQVKSSHIIKVKKKKHNTSAQWKSPFFRVEEKYHVMLFSLVPPSGGVFTVDPWDLPSFCRAVLLHCTRTLRHLPIVVWHVGGGQAEGLGG